MSEVGEPNQTDIPQEGDSPKNGAELEKGDIPQDDDKSIQEDDISEHKEDTLAHQDDMSAQQDDAPAQRVDTPAPQDDDTPQQDDTLPQKDDAPARQDDVPDHQDDASARQDDTPVQQDHSSTHQDDSSPHLYDSSPLQDDSPAEQYGTSEHKEPLKTNSKSKKEVSTLILEKQKHLEASGSPPPSPSRRREPHKKEISSTILERQKSLEKERKEAEKPPLEKGQGPKEVSNVIKEKQMSLERERKEAEKPPPEKGQGPKEVSNVIKEKQMSLERESHQDSPKTKLELGLREVSQSIKERQKTLQIEKLHDREPLNKPRSPRKAVSNTIKERQKGIDGVIKNKEKIDRARDEKQKKLDAFMKLEETLYSSGLMEKPVLSSSSGRHRSRKKKPSRKRSNSTPGRPKKPKNAVKILSQELKGALPERTPSLKLSKRSRKKHVSAANFRDLHRTDTAPIVGSGSNEKSDNADYDEDFNFGFMIKGRIFKKYKYGKGKQRQIWLDKDLKWVYWGEERDKPKGQLLVENITAVRHGCAGSAHGELAFTICTLLRDLELRAETVETKTTWMEGIKHLIHRNRKLARRRSLDDSRLLRAVSI